MRHQRAIVDQSIFRQPVSTPQETRRQRTLRIGPQRAAEVVKKIRLCRQLGNPNVYDLRSDEPDKLADMFIQEIEAMRFELKNPGKTAAPGGIFETADD